MIILKSHSHTNNYSFNCYFFFYFSIEMSQSSKNSKSNPKLKNVFNWQLDLNKHGSVVDMSEITTGGQNVLTFVTSRGRLCGLDLRTRELAWDLENDPKYGKIILYTKYIQYCTVHWPLYVHVQYC